MIKLHENYNCQIKYLNFESNIVFPLSIKVQARGKLIPKLLCAF